MAEQTTAVGMTERDHLIAAAVRKLRMYIDEHDDDEIEALLAEYDRRGAELAEAREELAENFGVMRLLRRQRDEAQNKARERGVEVLRLRAQRDDVLALHPRYEGGPDGDVTEWCGSCSTREGFAYWPCPTARALGVEE